MAEIIDGKAAGEEVVAKVKERTAQLIAEAGVQPGLAVVIVGEDPASQVYVNSKSKKAKDCGFHSEQHTLPAETSEAELLALVEKLNADP
ncbi:MAG TPA: tetrahydrofolate dehydrogenase/cyclohydrolase catalytic domain-containing protein, partial [Tianweitania sediminis]|nr:tetrahydrofolate dehydrogenase/cyclohydrolase catalytic domain-containing protein [Tianweitania sediminis]